MSWLMLSEIAQLTNGTVHGADVAVEQVQRDSRTAVKGDLFLALKGERFDAHDFVADIVGKASAALVERVMDAPIPQVVVADVRLAMRDLAAALRQRFDNPVIALTGSNGKTTLKEMLTAILRTQGDVLATLGNLNNDLGVPLTLFRLRAEHDYAVIEMGANHFGEIAYLTDMVKPDVAILNNAGAAHLEGFGDIKGVSRAKGEIFDGLSVNGVAIINADDTYADYWRGLNTERRVLTFGMEQPATVNGEFVKNGVLQIRYQQGERQDEQQDVIAVQLALLGQHNAMNALAATAAALAIGVDLAAVKQGLEAMQPVKGRLCPHTTASGALVIDDSYNANPTSTEAAIQVLAAMQGRKLLVLGDMGELGDNGVELHATVGRLAKEAGIDGLYGLGEMSAHACAAFGQGACSSQDFAVLLEELNNETLTKDTTVLIKGSRSARMERFVEALC